MKKALFITNNNYSEQSFPNPWGSGVFNNRNLKLEAREGILTFKKSFSLKDKTVKSVILRSTALGVYEMYLNGERIGRKVNQKTVYDELKPGWTDYTKRVYEIEYDITDICQNANLFVAEVSTGWWSGRISFGYYGFKNCAFCGEFEITYKDGETQIIATDDSWETAICGPVMRADFYDGEYYDATIPHAYSAADYSFTKAAIFSDFKGEIKAHNGPYIRIKPELERIPVCATVYSGTIDNNTDFGEINIISQKVGIGCENCELRKGQSLTLDMGQNMVGRPRFKIKAPKGTRIEIFFAEMLNDSGEKNRGNDGPKGSIYIENYRSALSRLVYITSGEAEEEFSPLHTFYGFRYLEFNTDNDIQILSVKGEVIGSDLEEIGTFECSHANVNKLYSNVVWGMRSNYLSVPTDCPQRDERIGWTGDTQIFGRAASYMANTASFMHKWLADARDSQIGFGGAYADVIPRILTPNENTDFQGGAAWADAGLIVPYTVWLMYNDTDIVAEHYDSMEKYMKFLEQFGFEGPNDTWGDWLNYEVTDKKYISVCYYAYDALLMEKFSNILGKTDRALYYKSLKENIIAYWKNKYIKNGELIFNSQTACLLPLAFDMVEGKEKTNIINKLRLAIENNDYTLSTGFVGTGILCQTLAKVGLYDLCYNLLLQTKDPSWLYSVNQGATTVWERWNSYTKKSGFGDINMNSFNHYAYGAVAEWFYSGICGIMPLENSAGFSHFILAPTPDMRTFLPDGQEKITFARASYNSVSGRIESEWKKCDWGFEYIFTIPSGQTAEIKLLSENDGFFINDVYYSNEELNAKREENRIVFTLKSGKYVIK
ncbi:MAG: family 78 glycoside hydrolase catalytic domain [Clostridia bacterium]|nr:family 78 glycoside hydrolase catalytic domain [Clostridia bacterium]